jgi:ribosomal protein S18 acetylase RimI-like enzyme
MDTVFESLTFTNMDAYIEVGTQSYREHYLHLWENQIPTYLKVSFTEQVVRQELNDSNCLNFLVKHQNKNAGILKISLDQGWGKWAAKEALYLHRIYLLKDTTGKNIGKKVLDFIRNEAQKRGKKIIWLEAMKKGRAKNFYQKNGYEIIGESAVELSGVLKEEKEMWVMGKHI